MKGSAYAKKMTIQVFADRTGLPSSTLRYYEKERLLLADVRSPNGYRLYREDQIPTAVKIHSLRQAGIQLAEIREFLHADTAQQWVWMNKWRSDIDAKLSLLHAAKQFLYGVGPRDEHVRLVKWDAPVQMVWFRHQVQRQLNPFAQVMEQRAAQMRNIGLHVQEAFVKQEQVTGDNMIGKVGFRLRGKVSFPDEEFKSAEIETIEPTLFVVLDCLSNDPYACFSTMLVLQSFGYKQVGPNMERYQLHDKSHYEWMIPVVHGSAVPPKESGRRSDDGNGCR
ncbi:hypothetical protein PAECIP111802_00294 [Paenibacillus allorhizosphaerae]|uniref:HTH merR-type domain-containing protein n=1 Tax=Paenibacillus allorhizosphaerae TaxID=2849866 RepID=A0ABM8VAH1_9BACL|nr:hypothetical protein PAECIP111802_00294 [Paenibacillus allorhizosphaerae]